MAMTSSAPDEDYPDQQYAHVASTAASSGPVFPGGTASPKAADGTTVKLEADASRPKPSATGAHASQNNDGVSGPASPKVDTLKRKFKSTPDGDKKQALEAVAEEGMHKRPGGLKTVVQPDATAILRYNSNLQFPAGVEFDQPNPKGWTVLKINNIPGQPDLKVGDVVTSINHMSLVGLNEDRQTQIFKDNIH